MASGDGLKLGRTWGADGIAGIVGVGSETCDGRRGPLNLVGANDGAVPGPLIGREGGIGVVPGPLIGIDGAVGVAPGPLIGWDDTVGVIPGPLIG